MLKHDQIILKLTDEQKIRLLTSVGSLKGKDFKILGIPTVRIGNIKDCFSDEYPHSAMLVHSWDRDLFYDVAKSKISAMQAEGTDVVTVPGPKIKLSPFRKELSEDPYLAKELSVSGVSAADDLGAVSVLSGCYLTDSDVEWMDFRPDERVINEYLVDPYKKAATSKIAKAAFVDLRSLGAEYNAASLDAIEHLKNDYEFLVCAVATDENTVELISHGVICLEASSNALELALSRYRKMKMKMEYAVEDDSEEDSGRGMISDEELNRAIDNVLEFLFRCHTDRERVKAVEEDRHALALQASLESSVLLKNKKGVLPLDKHKKIGIVGSAEFDDESVGDASKKCSDLLEGLGYTSSGFAVGYDNSTLPDKAMIDEAVALAEKSDVVLLFMGFGHKRERLIPKSERLTLPAKQLRLADVLSKTGKPVVAVISASHAPDIDFTRDIDAVLISPLETDVGIMATAKILAGEYNPSGKLAYTLYASSETAFEKRAVYKHNHGVMSGPFIGYRYYDTAEMYVGYPFGHGISYTTFKYSGLSVKKGEVTFSVENTGEVAGTEIAQVYVGAKRSSVIRPKKELRAFERIELLPGEKKTVRLPLEIPSVYSRDELSPEGGTYIVYVGSSVTDVRLKASITVDGKHIEPDGKRLSDYLQTVPNIIEDKYTLEANYNSMKKSIRNILFGVGALALAICLGVFNAFLPSSEMFLGIIAGVLAAASILFFILEAVDRSRTYARERKQIDEANKEHFEGAEELPFLSTDMMFKDEFDTEEVTETVQQKVEDVIDDSQAAFIDGSFTMMKAVEEFKKFAEERGYRFADGTVENLLTSLATTKLIITDGLNSSDFNSVMLLIGEYFGNNVYVDVLDSHSAADSFLSHDMHGEHSRKNISLALEDASRSPEKVQLAAFDGVTAENVMDVVGPFMTYLYSQKRDNEIFMFNEMGVNVGYNISTNLWLVLNLDTGAGVNLLPREVVGAASVVNVAFSKIKPASSTMFSHGFSRYQIEYILEKESSRADVPEELWKKVDKLEKYATELSGYRIGNKMWRRFERQIGLLMASRLELADAADIAVGAKLIPSVAASIEGKLGDDTPSLAETLNIVFGEESIAYCKTVMSGFAALQKHAAKQTAPESEPQRKENENASSAFAAPTFGFGLNMGMSAPVASDDARPPVDDSNGAPTEE